MSMSGALESVRAVIRARFPLGSMSSASPAKPRAYQCRTRQARASDDTLTGTASLVTQRAPSARTGQMAQALTWTYYWSNTAVPMN